MSTHQDKYPTYKAEAQFQEAAPSQGMIRAAVDYWLTSGRNPARALEEHMRRIWAVMNEVADDERDPLSDGVSRAPRPLADGDAVPGLNPLPPQTTEDTSGRGGMSTDPRNCMTDRDAASSGRPATGGGA